MFWLTLLLPHLQNGCLLWTAFVAALNIAQRWSFHYCGNSFFLLRVNVLHVYNSFEKTVCIFAAWFWIFLCGRVFWLEERPYETKNLLKSIEIGKGKSQSIWGWATRQFGGEKDGIWLFAKRGMRCTICYTAKSVQANETQTQAHWASGSNSDPSGWTYITFVFSTHITILTLSTVSLFCKPPKNMWSMSK